VDYTFAQVGIYTAQVGYSGNCGNISSGVGPFAIDEGMVDVQDGVADVRIWNTNTSFCRSGIQLERWTVRLRN
jgi:2-methylaconitate isomerase